MGLTHLSLEPRGIDPVQGPGYSALGQAISAIIQIQSLIRATAAPCSRQSKPSRHSLGKHAALKSQVPEARPRTRFDTIRLHCKHFCFLDNLEKLHARSSGKSIFVRTTIQKAVSPSLLAAPANAAHACQKPTPKSRTTLPNPSF